MSVLEDKIKEQQEEIERLNNIIDKKEQFLGDNIKRLEREVVKRDNIINELEKYLIKIRETSTPQERIMARFVLEYIKILKGEELDGKRPYDELDEILELERDN